MFYGPEIEKAIFVKIPVFFFQAIQILIGIIHIGFGIILGLLSYSETNQLGYASITFVSFYPFWGGLCVSIPVKAILLSLYRLAVSSLRAPTLTSPALRTTKFQEITTSNGHKKKQILLSILNLKANLTWVIASPQSV